MPMWPAATSGNPWSSKRPAMWHVAVFWCVILLVFFLTACGNSVEDEAKVTRKNGELHQMAMKALKAPHVKTWDQLIAELEKMPTFPKEKLPPKSPSAFDEGESARKWIAGRIASGGDSALTYAFKEGRKLEDVDRCFHWPLYSRRNSLAADPPPLDIYVDKSGEIVAYRQADPNR